MLFNIVVDMLAIMIKHAKVDGLIEGVIPHLVDGGLYILQYADDTIVFMEHDFEKARNLKLILSTFELLLSLKINFYKSGLFCFGESQNEVNAYADLFGCGKGQFPMRYLGIPIHSRRLAIAKQKLVEERVQKRLRSWKDKLLSLGERLILINLVLTNMVLHMILFFLFPKGVIYKLDYYWSIFFWLNEVWFVVPMTRGLGIHDLEVKNTALLDKWLFKLLIEDETC
jgi:hypothetical protein